MTKHIKHNRQNKSLAGKWMAENGHSWGKPKQKPGGENAKTSSTKHKRIRRGKVLGQRVGNWDSVKDFVDAHRSHSGDECVFVPAQAVGSPARVNFLGKVITASRYMCLLTHGAPKYEDAVARHACGNGHLSCINPRHIVWGDRGDNQSDANHHRAVGADVQDRINSLTR